MIAQGMILDDRAAVHPFEASVQGDPCPGDRGGPCAAIGLQYIAVEGDLTFAQGLKIGDGAQTARRWFCRSLVFDVTPYLADEITLDEVERITI